MEGDRAMSHKSDGLLRALRNYDSAKTAHDEEMIKCDHSWGYHGHRYIYALEQAGNEFATALNELIDERIELSKT